MRRLLYLESAEQDLSQILHYIAQDSGNVDTALRFVSELRSQCRKLASLPGKLGRPRPELRPDIRSFPVKGYVIFFSYQEDAVEVVNLLAGMRDIDGYFAENPDL